MKKIGKIVGLAVLSLLATVGLFTIALIIYYWPVIDRLAIRPCHYYPKAFADCREINN